MRCTGWGRQAAVFLSLVVLSVTSCAAQDTLNFPVLGEILRLDPAVNAVLGDDAKLEVIAAGFDWTEGPCWVAGAGNDPGYLLFSDIPPNRINKWVEGTGVSLFMQPSGYTGVADYGGEPGSNGLLLDPQGRLVCCEHGDRRLSVLTKDGGKRTLVDNYQGKRLNSPNDAVFKSNGDLYFTDPPYGLPNRWEDPLRELDFCGVYRLAKDGKLTLLTEEMTRPNGIGFSPDEKTLYVAQSDPDAPIWKAFPLKDDGTLGPSRVLYDASKELAAGLPGLPDGMAVAQSGHVFATGPGGVFIFSPEGKLVGRISTGERTSNCTLGGADGSTLYITADMYLCRIQTKAKAIRR
ncbi:MAG: SMP-30/gluconolactonase/LRE family protein [Planctomycetaceae bacterium]|nr:SMP-30/gluconolactonase/LRE family protein [Planctomycetaceae bacterium]